MGEVFLRGEVFFMGEVFLIGLGKQAAGGLKIWRVSWGGRLQVAWNDKSPLIGTPPLSSSEIGRIPVLIPAGPHTLNPAF